MSKARFRSPGDAIAQLADALAYLDIATTRPTPGSVALDVDGKRTGPWEVAAVGAVTPASIAAMIDRGDVEGRRQLVVASRSHRAAIDQLLRAGIGYYGLDTGRIAIHGDGLRIDTTIPPPAAVDPPAGPALTPRGRVGRIVAYELLDRPDQALSPRKDSARLDMSSSALSLAVRALAAHGLIDEEGRALIPELFAALTDVWLPARHWLASPPDPDMISAEGSTTTATGPGGAVAWGAPLVASGDTLDLYTPTDADTMLLVRQCGPAPASFTPWSVATAPLPQACQPPPAAPILHGFPVAPLLTTALDLATDPARGGEALDAWTPNPDVHARVW